MNRLIRPPALRPWRVSWREPSGRLRSRAFAIRNAALAFVVELGRRGFVKDVNLEQRPQGGATYSVAEYVGGNEKETP